MATDDLDSILQVLFSDSKSDESHSPAWNDRFYLVDRDEREKDPPTYMAGFLLDETVCAIYKTEKCNSTRAMFLYHVPASAKLPPRSLIQLIRPKREGEYLVAEAVLYFTPLDGYTRMGQLGRTKTDDRWMAPDPAVLRKRAVAPWPFIGQNSGPEQEKQTAPVLPASPACPPDISVQTPIEMDIQIPRKKKPEDAFADAVRERLQRNPSIKQFTRLLRANACAEDQAKPGSADLPAGIGKSDLKMLYQDHRQLYSSEVQTELDGVMGSLSTLGEKSWRRVRNLVRYAYNRTEKFEAVPAEELRAELERALPGQQDVTDRVMAAVQGANATRKPLTLLLLDEEEITAQEIMRCFSRVMPGAASLDGSIGALNLQGMEISYEGAAVSQTIRKLDGPLLCISKLEAVYWCADKDKDSAAPSLNSLIGNREFSDHFLGVTVRYYGHIVCQAASLDLKYRLQFSQVVDIPVRTHEEKVRLLQARARAAVPAFTLETEAAEEILRQYAPGSLSRALNCLVLLGKFSANLDRPVAAGDLTAALGKPSLTQDEQLVSDLEACSAELVRETALEAGHQARVLLGTTADEQEKTVARQMLSTLVEYQKASRPAELPPKEELRRNLDAELFGLEREKEIVIQTLHSHRPRVLFFWGAPGTGKTALARALAKASGRELVRIDMAALRPEQLTGCAPLFGRSGEASILVRRIVRAGRPAVILLDEMDKAQPFLMEHLLELFENQRLFSDAFIGRVDLSRHLILLSGNSLKISRPLLDRCQVIQMRPYSPGEKMAILQRKWYGALAEEELALRPLSDDLARWVICRCASGGARDVEDIVARLVRLVSAGQPLPHSEEELSNLLGSSVPPLPLLREPGSVYCLAALEDGGGVVSPLLVRENSLPGASRLHLLGMKGETMRESAEMALTWAAGSLGRPVPPLTLAMDASPKDGPSAGLAIALAYTSLLTGQALEGVAASGELMLDGTVLPVGGVASKLNGALRCAQTVRTLFLPADNRVDVTPRLMAEIKKAGIELYFVHSVQEAIEHLTGREKEKTER